MLSGMIKNMIGTQMTIFLPAMSCNQAEEQEMVSNKQKTRLSDQKAKKKNWVFEKRNMSSRAITLPLRFFIRFFCFRGRIKLQNNSID